MTPRNSPSDSHEVVGSSKRSLIVIVIVALVGMGVLTYAGWTRTPHGSNTTTTVTLPTERYPVGSVSATEPSGYAPPSATALAGYKLTYLNDFTTAGLPAGWLTFHGVPGGDPGGQFGPKHVTVKNGELVLTTYRDPDYQNRWVTGGLCQCELPNIYGAYFVRSRATGVGPNEVQLLWPSNNQWPPEIDFNETPSSHQSSATVHWGQANYTQQILVKGVNMMAWHTWGVIWSKSEIVYTLDGHAWGVITNPQAIPRLPMRLDLEQRTECTIHVQCPVAPVRMLVDWIVEYHLS